MSGARGKIIPAYAYNHQLINIMYARDNDSDGANGYGQGLPDNGRPSKFYQFPRFQGAYLFFFFLRKKRKTETKTKRNEKTYKIVRGAKKMHMRLYRPLRFPGQAHGSEGRPRHFCRPAAEAEQGPQQVNREHIQREGADLARG